MFDDWVARAGCFASDRNNLMSVEYDGTELCNEADERIRTFQKDASREAGIFTT